MLSFWYLGIYWNNHHHMLQVTERVTGAILWANLGLLFCLSLFPFATGWMGGSDFARLPDRLLRRRPAAGRVAYYVLQRLIIASQGEHSLLAAAVGRDLKGKISLVIYAVAIPLAFVSPLARQRAVRRGRGPLARARPAHRARRRGARTAGGGRD